MKGVFLVIGALLLGGLVAHAEPKNLVLAARGQAATYQIVLPESAPACVGFAAEELRTLTKLLTGVTLGIVTNKPIERGIVLRVREGKNDGFRLLAQGEDLIISGNPRGVLYGVYELLERFGGIEFLTSWRTHIPRLDALVVPATLDLSDEPAFAMRDCTVLDMRIHPQFRARSRLNGLYSNRPNGIDPADPKFGGCYFNMARLYGCCAYAHTFRFLVPEDVYFKAHPEYYSEINGVRQRKQTQLCLTNPDVVEIVVSNVLEQVRLHPDLRVAGVSHDDNLNYCQCTNCAAVDAEEALDPTDGSSHAGTLIRFLNKVAERVTAVYPDVKIETLAYQHTRKPPTKTKPHPSLIICFCPIECVRSIPLDVSDADVPLYDPKAPFMGWKKYGRHINAEFCRNLEKWLSFGNEVIIWDYIQNFRYPFLPTPDLESMQANFQYFRNHGVHCLFPEGMGRAGTFTDFAAFKAYLMRKWLWNPDESYEKLRDRFLPLYYGKAAPYVREYLEKISVRWKTIESRRKLYCFAWDEPDIYPDDFLLWALDNYRAAEKVVANDPESLFAVQSTEIIPLATLLNRWSEKSSSLSEAQDRSKQTVNPRAPELVKLLLEREAQVGARKMDPPLTQADLKSWRRLECPLPPSDNTHLDQHKICH